MNVLQKKEEPMQEGCGSLLEMPTWSRCSSGQESAMMKPKAQAKALGPGGSTYRAEGAGDKEVGKVLNYFIVSESLERRKRNS